MSRKNREKKTEKKHKTWGIVMACITAVVTAGILYICKDMLPLTYIISACGAALIMIEALLFANIWKTSGIITNIISCILICCLLLGSYYVCIFQNTVEKVQEEDYTTVYMGIYVLDDDTAEEIEDLIGYEWGYDTLYEDYANMEAISHIEEATSQTIDASEYSGPFDLIDSLLLNETAIIMNEAYISVMEDVEGYEWVEDGIRKIASIEVNIPNESDTEEKEVDLGTFIVYISGIDSYGEISTNSRSDVNILAVVNTETGNILLINTPRDYYVTYEATEGVYDKLTHAGLLGVGQSESALETLYDIEIDYYVKMNFSGFETIIDALGGITVYSDVAFSSSVSDYSYTEGYNSLDGEAALYFARERKSFEDGDFQRGENQMKVIKAVFDKLLSFSTVANFQAVLEAVSDCIETDMNSDVVNSLIQLMISGTDWTMDSYGVTGTTGRATTYYSPHQELSVVFQDEDSINEAKELINSILYTSATIDDQKGSTETGS